VVAVFVSDSAMARGRRGALTGGPGSSASPERKTLRYWAGPSDAGVEGKRAAAHLRGRGEAGNVGLG
jgi:hypothetical protein